MAAGAGAGAAELVAGALWESAQDPLLAWQNFQGAATGALGVAVAVGEAVGGVGLRARSSWSRTPCCGSRPRSKSPLAGVVSEQRRVATVAVPLAELQGRPGRARPHDQRRHPGGGRRGLRSWLLTRGESVTNGES